MNSGKSLRNLDFGFLFLVALLLAEQAAVYLKLSLYPTYTGWEIGASLGSLAAIASGFMIPLGYSVVGSFFFLVAIVVWVTTHDLGQSSNSIWLLAIPANVLIATLFKHRVIRTKRILERLDALEDTNPSIDLDTGLGNREALADTLSKQANLARRYSDKYGFSIAMFKIEFLPLVLESLGTERYSKFLIEVSHAIGQQIRLEDSKFSIDLGRFVIVCPLTNVEWFPIVTDRVKTALTNLNIEDKRGNPLTLVVRAAMLHFDKTQFELYRNVDDVIAALERGTETDLVAEYI